jgi:hypothetical protein
VRAGYVAERVAVEGVMLQYAVDVKLDQMLATCYMALTESPMPVNPYPQLLHYLRAYAARLDLWKVRVAGGTYPAICLASLFEPSGPFAVIVGRSAFLEATTALVMPIAMPCYSFNNQERQFLESRRGSA